MLKLQLTRDGAYDDEYLELPATLADVGEVMSQLDETSSNVASPASTAPSATSGISDAT